MKLALEYIAGALLILGALASSYFFLDTRHAQAEDLKELKAHVERSFEEKELDDHYFRLEMIEMDLEERPDNKLIKARKRHVEHQIEKLLARSGEKSA